MGIPAISCWEIALLEQKGRISLRPDLLSWLHDALDSPVVQLLPLTPEIAARAVSVRSALRDPADCMIAATALEHGVPLVTADARLQAVPGLRIVW